MFKALKQKKAVPAHKKAQTFVEYTTLLGVIATIMIAMSPMVKRMTQGMVKVAADMVGCQENAEQIADDSGYMEGYNAFISRNRQAHTQERLGETYYVYDRDSVRTDSKQVTNSGFRKN